MNLLRELVSVTMSAMVELEGSEYSITHCESRPSWEIVMSILSAKLVDVISVAMPFTRPETSRDLEGKESSLTSTVAIFEKVLFLSRVEL